MARPRVRGLDQEGQATRLGQGTHLGERILGRPTLDQEETLLVAGLRTRVSKLRLILGLREMARDQIDPAAERLMLGDDLLELQLRRLQTRRTSPSASAPVRVRGTGMARGLLLGLAGCRSQRDEMQKTKGLEGLEHRVLVGRQTCDGQARHGLDAHARASRRRLSFAIFARTMSARSASDRCTRMRLM